MWDLALDISSRDMTGGIVSGPNEVIQRLVTRLNRELGEWFLDVTVGLPWYQHGRGLLGSRNKSQLDALIRRETLKTDGVLRILVMRTVYIGREVSIYMEILIEEFPSMVRITGQVGEVEDSWTINMEVL